MDKTILESKFARKITLDLIFREHSNDLKVKEISEINIFELTKGEYNNNDNYSFRGEARLDIPNEILAQSEIYKIEGTAFIKINGEDEEPEITITQKVSVNKKFSAG